MTQLTYPQQPVHHILKGSARRYGERLVLIDQEEHLTYEQLYKDSLKFARALVRLGIEKGDVVCVHLPNCSSFLVAYYGTLISGATFTPANPLLSEDELSHQLNDARARVIITSNSAVSFKETLIEHIIYVSDEGVEGLNFKQLLQQEEATPVAIDIDVESDLAHIAYTGGTTGRSKGVMLTHANVVTNVVQSCCFTNGGVAEVEDEAIVLNELPGDKEKYAIPFGTGRLLNVTPWYHAMGTVGYLNNVLLQGSTIILIKRFEPKSFLEAIAYHQVTSVGGAAPMFHALINVPGIEKMDLSSVKQVRSGASPISKVALEKLKGIFRNATVTEAYGLSEATMMLTSNPAEIGGKTKVGSVGIPTYDTKIRIVKEDGSEAATGEVGEVAGKGPQIMQGYLNNREETAIALRDGWLYTGDLGYVDDEGYVYIVDRKKDLILYKGYNVYPKELEEILYRHPEVATVAVVGVPHEINGEIPVAFVVLKNDQPTEPMKQALMGYVNDQVTPYKKIREVAFVKELPTSGAGKVLKRALRDRASEWLKLNQ
ncbi:class I adenylate-forming enzyme family protein [Geomicrobium sediminis]|uniref:Long-chain acyl-CoA synthetase n=1 Tax=Geomicrobium sediminis TaxID=1347788 RepID=A0ABS2P6X9_9BACL|nr:AMP-binding protein [Geomicrobium sediminis]MBM7631148.1 long-chain acyl-CoA synthetase [Geomicrobium sediminis]